jgi:hypothetical protein
VFRLTGTDLTRPVGPTSGNVLDPRPHLHRLHGRQVGAARAVTRNVATLLRGGESP